MIVRTSVIVKLNGGTMVFFQGQYIPSLSINYVALQRFEKVLPQLY